MGTAVTALVCLIGGVILGSSGMYLALDRNGWGVGSDKINAGVRLKVRGIGICRVISTRWSPIVPSDSIVKMEILTAKQLDPGSYTTMEWWMSRLAKNAILVEDWEEIEDKEDEEKKGN